MKKLVWPIMLVSGCGLALLLWLGFWQLERLAWKQAMIARVDAALAGPAISYDPNTIQGGEDFQKLRMMGRFSKEPPLRMLDIWAGGPGWRLLHAFETDQGVRLMVDRGVAPENMVPPAPEQTVTIEGITRRNLGGSGRFDVKNDPAANRWYWLDVNAMAQVLALTPEKGTRFVLRLLPGQPGTEGLQVDPPKANFRNNHLGYAITWFGLAIVLIVMTALFVRSRMKNA